MGGRATKYSGPSTTFDGSAALQWGHDQLIAEMSNGVDLRNDVDRLQLGRDQLIAEM